MNLKNLNVLLIIVILCSSSALMAQSKMSKKSKEQAVDARSADEKEEIEKDFAYVVMDLTGKKGRYTADMMMSTSSETKMQSYEAIAIQKEAYHASGRTAYPSEIDFLLAMKNMDMELIAVTQETGNNGPMKRFYFKKEFEVSK